MVLGVCDTRGTLFNIGDIVWGEATCIPLCNIRTVERLGFGVCTVWSEYRLWGILSLSEIAGSDVVGMWSSGNTCVWGTWSILAPEMSVLLGVLTVLERLTV